MAIKKSLATIYGINAEYWAVIGMPVYNRIKKEAEIIVAGYANENARNAQGTPLATVNVYISNITAKKEKHEPMTLEVARQKAEFNQRENVKNSEDENAPKKEGKYLMSDAEVIKAIKGKTFINGFEDVTTPHFDFFQTALTEKGWQTAAYEYLLNSEHTPMFHNAEKA